MRQIMLDQITKALFGTSYRILFQKETMVQSAVRPPILVQLGQGNVMRPLLYSLCILLFIIGQHAFAQPTIQYLPTNDRIELRDLEYLDHIQQPIKWNPYFSVYTGDHIPTKSDYPPVLGSYHIEDEVLIFTPRFRSQKGQTYTAQFHIQKFYHAFQQEIHPSEQTIKHTFTVPKPISTPTTYVTQIYPTSDTLPENLLKFYIHFSEPMQRGQTYTHIRLLNASGQEVSKPFLDITPELWSPNTQRFTLFFDPGRIKRGLMPHKDLGMALKENQTYRLVIEQTLKDADSNPLTTTHTKTFSVTPADRTSPNTKKWRITPPSKQTHDPLIIECDEPLDQALLNHLITVKNKNAQTLLGEIKTTHHETHWHFTPETPWSSGAHTIHINPILEDLAGNQLTRLFDVDTEKQPSKTTSITTITLPFQIP